MSDSTTRIVHLVPADGLGGVEAAVRSVRPLEHPDLKVLYISGRMIAKPTAVHQELSPKSGVGSPRAYLKALLAVRSLQPDIIVCSLWRSTLLGIIAKIILPKAKLIVMIHAITLAHWADRIVTKLGAILATEIWCDSEASKVASEARYKRKAKVISFRVAATTSSIAPRRPLNFVFWGRHVHFKDVPRAVRLFNRILTERPEARLLIYGDEGPATDSIRCAIAEASNPDAITMMGLKPAGEYPDPIHQCTFFIMTSKHEGMAVAVVEAMQLGLIPVVTPVGEIANYCRDEENSVLVIDDEAAALRLVDLTNQPQTLRTLSEAAVERWASVPDYSADFRRACLRVLSS